MIIVYNHIKIVKLIITNNAAINVDKESNSIIIFYNFYSIISKSFNEINKLLFSFNDYFFKKIKFKGKGFRLKIKKKKRL